MKKEEYATEETAVRMAVHYSLSDIQNTYIVSLCFGKHYLSETIPKLAKYKQNFIQVLYIIRKGEKTPVAGMDWKKIQSIFKLGKEKKNTRKKPN